MNAQQKLKEVEAEKELNRHGLWKQVCPGCDGSGRVYRDSASAFYACETCDGDGYVWLPKPDVVSEK